MGGGGSPNELASAVIRWMLPRVGPLSMNVTSTGGIGAARRSETSASCSGTAGSSSSARRLTARLIRHVRQARHAPTTASIDEQGDEDQAPGRHVVAAVGLRQRGGVEHRQEAVRHEADRQQRQADELGNDFDPAGLLRHRLDVGLGRRHERRPGRVAEHPLPPPGAPPAQRPHDGSDAEPQRPERSEPERCPDDVLRRALGGRVEIVGPEPGDGDDDRGTPARRRTGRARRCGTPPVPPSSGPLASVPSPPLPGAKR